MSAAVKFGTGLPAVQQVPFRVRPWEKSAGGAAILAAARAAEAAGFAWVACSDHPMVPVSRAEAMGPTWYDAGSTLAFVAGVTSRIALLTHVLVVPYRHPLLIAKQYGTLDHLSGGRVILGVGSGHLKPEFKILGADFERRGKVTDEYLHAIAAAWEHDVARFDGEIVAFRDVMVSPRVTRRPRPPFWVGGNSPAALRRAARLGEGWVPWQLTPEEFAGLAERARRLRAESGRGEPLELVAPMEVKPDATASDVVAEARRWRQAGATAFHLGVGAESFAQYLDRLAWLGGEVMGRVE